MAGRMMSLYILGSMGTTPLGALLVGWVTDVVSPRAAVGLGAGSALLVGLALLTRWYADRRNRSLAVDSPT
jgi:MFS-type transporter involved in bile tolerance (Atg22 family)